jgi:hypothetical protein
MQRPELTAYLSADEFQRWYWLKEELVAFCRSAQLTTSGSKPELAARIAAALGSRNAAPTSTARKPLRNAVMPTVFTLDTIIQPGWRCGPLLGAFFKAQCGAGFRFNAAVRDFIHTQAGHSLAEAIACYRASTAPDAPKQTIIAQNEYNQHTRDFYAANPGATRAQVLAAWRVRRGRRAD